MATDAPILALLDSIRNRYINALSALKAYDEGKCICVYIGPRKFCPSCHPEGSE